jgi:hypothetical protein
MVKICQNERCILPEFETTREDKKYCCDQCQESARIRRRNIRQAEKAKALGVSRNSFLSKRKSYATRRQRLVDFTYNHKIANGCSRCPERRPVCLDYHHLDRKQKSAAISELVAKRVSLGRLQKEIDKCILLCANCHRVQEITGDDGVGSSYRTDTQLRARSYTVYDMAPSNITIGEKVHLISNADDED